MNRFSELRSRCPYCGASPHSLCRTRSSRVVRAQPHKERLRRAEHDDRRVVEFAAALSQKVDAVNLYWDDQAYDPLNAKHPFGHWVCPGCGEMARTRRVHHDDSCPRKRSPKSGPT